MKNPYEINPSKFILRRLGVTQQGTIFIVEPNDQGALAMCNFRTLLVDFLFGESEGQWDVRNFQNNLQVTISNLFDIQRVRDNFNVA